MAKATRKPQQERSKATVDAIIEAAYICVAERGVAATTTRHIADVAGISVGSLYEYFGNKEAIFAAMNQRFVAEVVAMIKPLVPVISRLPIGEGIKSLLMHLQRFLSQNDNRYLKFVPQAMRMDIKDYMGPVSRVLMEVAMQHVMHHPEHMRLRRIPAMSYIFINGGVFSVVRHLSDPNPPISFEELAQGLADMVDHYVTQELVLTAATP
jgi:AcrR family transcriptional regulator